MASTDLTFTAIADGQPFTWDISGIRTRSATVVAVTFSCTPVGRRATNVVHINADITPDGFILNPGKRHWTSWVPVAQHLLRDLNTVRTLLRNEANAAQSATDQPTPEHDSGPEPTPDSHQHLLALLLTAYQLPTPVSRGVALRTIAGGYTGTTDQLTQVATAAADAMTDRSLTATGNAKAPA